MIVLKIFIRRHVNTAERRHVNTAERSFEFASFEPCIVRLSCLPGWHTELSSWRALPGFKISGAARSGGAKI